jgi:polyphosphate kinase
MRTMRSCIALFIAGIVGRLSVAQLVVHAIETATARNRARWNDGSDTYIDRDLSWVRFNERVLGEATNPAHPLLERVRFLSITASNLDEFFTVRVFMLKTPANVTSMLPTVNASRASRRLLAVNERVLSLMLNQQRALLELYAELAQQNVVIVPSSELSNLERQWLDVYFKRDVLPHLQFSRVSSKRRFPFVPSKGAGLILQEQNDESGEKLQTVLFSAAAQRFIRLPPSHDSPGAIFWQTLCVL